MVLTEPASGTCSPPLQQPMRSMKTVGRRLRRTTEIRSPWVRWRPSKSLPLYDPRRLNRHMFAVGPSQPYARIWPTESPFKHWNHSHGVKHSPSYTLENDLFTGHYGHFARLIDSWAAAMRVAERFPHPITIVCQPSLSASLRTSLYTPSPVAIKTNVPGDFLVHYPAGYHEPWLRLDGDQHCLLHSQQDKFGNLQPSIVHLMHPDSALQEKQKFVDASPMLFWI